MKKQSPWDLIFTPHKALIAGAVMTLIYLLGFSLKARLLGWLFLMGVTLFSGRKKGWLFTCIFLITVTLLNLYPPTGRVLFSVGNFPITWESLNSGVLKAVTFSGLILLSRLTIRPGLRLPGRVGGFVAEVFGLYQSFWDRRHRISIKDLTGSLDELLMEELPGDTRTAESQIKKTGWGSWIPVFLLPIILLILTRYIAPLIPW